MSSSAEGGSKGRFTRMFDREFISDALARKKQEMADEAELAAVDRSKKTSHRMQVAVSMAERFLSRREQLGAKFPEMEARTTEDALGVIYIFPPGKGSSESAQLEFEVEVSHQGAALHVHSRSTFAGKMTADRVSMAEQQVDLGRVDRFVERKILDFVRKYLGE